MVEGSTDALTVMGTELIIEDDDERGVTVRGTPSTGTLVTVEEGESGTYTVVLDAAPAAGDVRVTATVSGSEEVTVSPEALTFTGSDWDVVRTVTVTAAHDPDAAPETATVTHAVTGADYESNGVTAADVTVRVTDDDPLPALTVGLESETVAEAGGTAEVRLTTVTPFDEDQGGGTGAGRDGGSGRLHDQ